jgi:hypothetical protein
MILGWRTVIAMWKADKKLAKSMREDRRRRSEEWAREMEEARRSGEWHEVWGLARKIAGTGLGPKRRTYGDIAGTRTTAEEVAEYLEGEGPDGGCRMVPAGMMEEGELEGGLLEMARRHLDERRTRAGERRSMMEDQEAAAWEDLDGLSAALKEGRGRRSVPAWSAPKEAWMLALCEAKRLGGRGGDGGGTRRRKEVYSAVRGSGDGADSDKEEGQAATGLERVAGGLAEQEEW